MRYVCRDGFLLIEACVSILLLGFLGCMVSAWYLHVIALEKEIIERIQAVMIARSLLERYKAFGVIPAIKYEPFFVSWIIEKDIQVCHYRRVTISVQSKNKQKTYRLTTGIYDQRVEPH